MNNRACVNKAGLDVIIKDEIVSQKYYNRKLFRPIYPGGMSGVTIGIGYDLGYHKKRNLVDDWGRYLNDDELTSLSGAIGITGPQARYAAQKRRNIVIPLSAAEDVFYKTSIPKYYNKAYKAFGPNMARLAPAAQAMLLSLVYNRGASMKGDRRREMVNIRSLIQSFDGDYITVQRKIAKQVRQMKRLWIGKGLRGLLARRDREASIIQSARWDVPESDLICFE